jgi:hypothetical protein
VDERLIRLPSAALKATSTARVVPAIRSPNRAASGVIEPVGVVKASVGRGGNGNEGGSGEGGDDKFTHFGIS